MPDEWYPSGEGVAHAALHVVAGERTRVVSAGDPTRPAIVLLHGWGASAYSFRKLIPALARSGFRVLAPDLRGHGGSDRPAPPEPYTSEAMADRTAAVLRALRIAPVVVVGQSIGGAIVLDLARRHPDLVPGAVLLSSIGFTRLRRVDALRRLAVWRWAPSRPPRWVIALVMRRIYGVRGRWTERDVDEYWAPLRAPASVTPLLNLVRAFDFAPRDPAPVRHLSGRLHVLFGDRDRPVPLREAVSHARRFAGARIQVLHGVGHVPAEEAPDEVAAAILGVASAVHRDAPHGREDERRP